MTKVRLKLPSWIATKLGFDCSGWFTMEREVEEGTTVSDFLMGMVAAYPSFRESIYNPDAGIVTEQINLVINDRLLTYREITQTRLSDGDTLLVFPLYVGG